MAGRRGDPRTGALLLGAADRRPRRRPAPMLQPDEVAWVDETVAAPLRAALGEAGLRGRDDPPAASSRSTTPVALSLEVCSAHADVGRIPDASWPSNEQYSV